MVSTGISVARRARTKGGAVTVTTVLALVAGLGLTVLGLGASEHAVATYDASSWLWSSAKGEVARVNGVTGRVDTRLQVPKTRGHTVQIAQTDRFLLLRDVNTGVVSSLDLATLQITSTTPTTAGLGVTVALHEDAAFIVDTVQGVVRQIDPSTLAPVGEPIQYPPGITGGTFDGAGRLWIAVPSEGTVSAVTAAPVGAAVTPVADGAVAADDAEGGAGTDGAAGAGGGSPDPQQVRTLAVAPPRHDLVLSALDDGVAVLNRTTNVLTVVRGDEQREISLGTIGPGTMADRTNGADVPVTVVDDRHVYIVSGDTVHSFTVPGDGPRLRPAVAWAGLLYCADDATGRVYVINYSGELVDTIVIKRANGPLELEIRENHLFINAPNGSTARVVNDQHHVRVVDKYANDILGGDPPKEPPPPPPPPKKPTAGPPGAPPQVTAAAGNAQVRVSWKEAPANGSPIQKYVVEGADQTHEVGANQRSVEITGLVNGQTYRFTVHAVNAKGAGPTRTSNPVVPTAEVPDPPESVDAQALPDGSVEVTWPAANGQGRDVVRYQVTAISEGVTAPIGEPAGTTLTIPDGALEYGVQYAFTVVAVNDRGAASEESPVSGTVVPFTVPAPVVDLAAATVPDRRGTIQVAWQPGDSHGRPITHYVVAAGGTEHRVQDGTAATLDGFGNGETVTVRVFAVNEAGSGPDTTTTARTIDVPTVTATNPPAPGHNSISVPFTVNDGGSPVTCTIAVNGGAASAIDCRGGPVTGLWPGTTYRYQVTVTNAAGSAQFTGSQTTPTLSGQVLCNTASYCGRGAPNGGIWVYTTPNQNGTAVGDTYSPDRYEAICWTRGNATINAEPYGGKRDNRWIRIKFRGDNYIPFAWFRRDNGDNPGMLPGC